MYLLLDNDFPEFTLMMSIVINTMITIEIILWMYSIIRFLYLNYLTEIVQF